MILEKVFDDLRVQLGRPGAQSRFDNAKVLAPALAAFATPLDVVGFLNEQDAERATARAAVTRVLLEGVRAGGDDLWSSLLTLAFAPTLLRLACAIQATRPCLTEDQELGILEMFMETAATFDCENQLRYAPLALVFATRRAVFRDFSREAARARTELPTPPDPLDDELGGADDDPHALLEGAEYLHQLQQLAPEVAGHSPAQLQMLMDSMTTNVPLWALVRATFPGVDETRVRSEYDRARALRRKLHRLARHAIQHGTRRRSSAG